MLADSFGNNRYELLHRHNPVPHLRHSQVVHVRSQERFHEDLDMPDLALHKIVLQGKVSFVVLHQGGLKVCMQQHLHHLRGRLVLCCQVQREASVAVPL